MKSPQTSMPYAVVTEYNMDIRGVNLTGLNIIDVPIILDNLVLYYDPNDPASYPGSGTTINSLAPTNLTGTMTNITYTDPYFSYNGTSSTVSVADNALLEPSTGDFTLEAWVY